VFLTITEIFTKDFVLILDAIKWYMVS